MKNTKDVKFNFIEFNPTIKCCDINSSSLRYPTATHHQSCIVKDTPYPALNIDIYQIAELASKNTNTNKQQAPFIQMFDINTHALKKFTDITSWNGVIALDLDLKNSELLKNAYLTNDEVYNQVHLQMLECCKITLKDNFLYFEKSNSGTGVHILFYYDVDTKTKEYRDAIADYCRQQFTTSLLKWLKRADELLNEEGVFDDVYKRPYQKIYITANDYYVNPDCNGIYDKEKVIAGLNKKINNNAIYSITDSNVKMNYDNISYTITNNKREMHHGLRMELYLSLCELYKNKEIVDKAWKQLVKTNFIEFNNYTYTNFIEEPDRNKWYFRFVNEGYHGDPKILEEYGFSYDVSNQIKIKYTNTGGGYEVKSYLSEEYMDLLRNTINNNNVCTLIGNTGIGKTEAIKKLLLETNGIVLVPFNSLRNMYRINHKYNELISNGVLSIWDNDNYITKERELVNVVGYTQIVKEDDIIDVPFIEYNKNMPNAMVFDQLVKIQNEDLYGKTIFVDESHILFVQQDFRPKLSTLLKKLNEIKDKCKIVLISATPLEETKILESTTTLKFWKYRPIINTTIHKVDDPFYMMRKYVKAHSKHNYYNRILVFSDICAAKLYDEFRINEGKNADNKVSILHTRYWERGNPNNRCEQIIKNELLDTRIVLGTSLVYNGVNFQNKNEHNLVIVDFNEGVDNVWKVVQSVGRLRNSTCDLVILFKQNNSEVDKLERLKEERESALNLISVNLPKGLVTIKHKLTDEDYYNALTKIEEYNAANSNIEELCRNLDEWGYFNYKIVESFEDKQQHVNKLKKLISEKVIEVFNNTEANKIKEVLKEEIESDFVGVDYFKREINKIYRFIDKYDVTIEYLCKFIKVFGVKAIDDLKQIFKAISISNKEWELTCEIIKKSHSNPNSFVAKRNNTDIKNVNKIREQYKDRLVECPLLKLRRSVNDNILVDCKFGVMEEYYKFELERQKEISKKREQSGKEGGKKNKNNTNASKKIKDLNTGKKYNTVNEAAEQLNVNRGTITRWLKCGKFAVC